MSTQRARAVLVTGTDTGIGKTVIACALIAGLRTRGLRVGVYKPVETGCTAIGGKLHGADVAELLAVAGGQQLVETAASYLFEAPAAPLVAAESVGTRVDPLRLVADLERIARSYDFVVVEGAGGLLVPIADGYTYLDFARQACLPIVCVVGSRLGCINHALLTLRVLGYSGIQVHGFIVNQLAHGQAAEAAAESNRRAIARFTGARNLGVFPHVDPAEPDRFAVLGRIAEQTLDLASLL